MALAFSRRSAKACGGRARRRSRRASRTRASSRHQTPRADSGTGWCSTAPWRSSARSAGARVPAPAASPGSDRVGCATRRALHTRRHRSLCCAPACCDGSGWMCRLLQPRRPAVRRRCGGVAASSVRHPDAIRLTPRIRTSMSRRPVRAVATKPKDSKEGKARIANVGRTMAKKAADLPLALGSTNAGSLPPDGGEGARGVMAPQRLPRAGRRCRANGSPSSRPAVCLGSVHTEAGSLLPAAGATDAERRVREPG